MADLNVMLRDAFGADYTDLRATLPGNPNGPNGPFLRRPLLGVDILAVHHTVGARTGSWEAIARDHVNNRKFAGIGYHVGIRLGKVSYLGDVELGRACCEGQNHRVVCVAMTGNYETTELVDEDKLALGRVVDVLQSWAQSTVGRRLKLLGHKEVPGQATACPGVNLLPEVRRLAALPAGPVTPDRAALLAAAASRQVLPLNRQAALLKRIAADGFMPTSNEFRFEAFVAQRAERFSDGKVRVYFVSPSNFADVRFVEA
jgi:hypothetical protein